MTSAEALLQAYPNCERVKVRFELDAADFDTLQAKLQRKKSEGGVVGLVWLDSETIILTERSLLHAGWGLPGGTVEAGETFDVAFLREVLEETTVKATITRLVMLEDKTFVSPFGHELHIWLAVFEAKAAPNQTAVTTKDAEREGLVVRAFNIADLPADMIFKDAEKIQKIISHIP